MVGRCVWLAAMLLACAPADPYDLRIRGPGRVAVVFEHQNEDSGWTTELRVFDEDGSRAIAIEQPTEARWLTFDTLLIATRTADEASSGVPEVALSSVSWAAPTPRPLPVHGRLFDFAPDPSGQWLALIAETDELGESELQVRNAATGALVARRAQTLDAPHWDPSGHQLVVTQTRPDSDVDDADEGVGFGGVVLSWPRLARLRRDLNGELERLPDGADGEHPAPGGTIGLWWADSGIFARQRQGLARCDPGGGQGCSLVHVIGSDRAIVHGCPVGRDGALLVVRGHERATELLHVDLVSGAQQWRFALPRTTSILSVDWVGP